jgi:hypothetical protein
MPVLGYQYDFSIGGDGDNINPIGKIHNVVPGHNFAVGEKKLL